MDRGKAKDRSSTPRRWMLAVCALVLLVLPGAAGCGESGEEKAAARRRAAAAAAAHARALAVGRKEFAENCESCHTLAGKHYTEPIIEYEAPNLDEVRLKRDYVRWRVEYGGPAMASFTAEMSRAQLAALITYVTETAGRNVETGEQPAEQVEAGREVFAEHCAACHGIAGRAATGTPPFPGMDFNLLKPSVRLVQTTVRRGIPPPDQGMMPSFRGVLDDAQIEAVARYVNAVAAEGPAADRSPFAE
jgi:cytochrome c oxidase cbb3-type subunit III